MPGAAMWRRERALMGDYGWGRISRVLEGPPVMAAREPILNVPRSVAGVAALLILVQIIRGLLPDDLDLTLLLTLAFIPARYSGAALELPGGYVTAVTSFVTYMVVHAGWVHLLVNLAWMLAFGSAVARRMGDLKFLGFSVLCGIAGALRFIFSAERQPGQRAPDFIGAPRMSLGETLTDKRMIAFLVFWVVLNAYFGLSSVKIAGEQGGIAWEAHIGGFLCGLLLFGAFDREQHAKDAPRLA